MAPVTVAYGLLERGRGLLVDAALGLVEPGPASLPPVARPGAGLASDRRVALVVQRVVGQVVAEDVSPHVPFAPVGQRIDLPHVVGLITLELGRRGASR